MPRDTAYEAADLPIVDAKELWDEITLTQQRLGLSNTQLGEVMGYTRSAFYRLRKNKRVPKIKAMIALARMSNTSLDHFFPIPPSVQYSHSAESPSERPPCLLLASEDFTPQTIKIAQIIEGLSVQEKMTLLDVLREDDFIECIERVASHHPIRKAQLLHHANNLLDSTSS